MGIMLNLRLLKKRTTEQVDDLRYSLSSNIFLSPPPALCFTFSRDRIRLVTSQEGFSSWIWYGIGRSRAAPSQIKIKSKMKSESKSKMKSKSKSKMKSKI